MDAMMQKVRRRAHRLAAAMTYTHVLHSGSGLVTSISPRRDQDEFACRLRRFAVGGA